MLRDRFPAGAMGQERQHAPVFELLPETGSTRVCPAELHGNRGGRREKGGKVHRPPHPLEAPVRQRPRESEERVVELFRAEERIGVLTNRLPGPSPRGDGDAQGEPRADPLVAPGEVEIALPGAEVDRRVPESLGHVDDDESWDPDNLERSDDPRQGQPYAIMSDLGEEESIRSGIAVAPGKSLGQLATPDPIPDQVLPDRDTNQLPAVAQPLPGGFPGMAAIRGRYAG